MTGAVPERPAHGLGQDVDGRGTPKPELLHGKAGQHVQHLHEQHAGTGRRHGIHLRAPERTGDRHPVDDAIPVQIVLRQQPADCLHVADDRLGHATGIERRLAVLGNRAQRVGQVALDEQVAGL